MVDVTPLVKQGTQIIQSYASGQFRVSGTLYKTPILVTADQTSEWRVKDPHNLIEDDFQQLIENAAEHDVILFGTGKKIKFLSPELKKSLRVKKITPDIMDTGAACRTYNVLVAEGRRVIAALLPA